MTEKTGHSFLYNFVLILVVPTLILLVVVSGDLITHPLAIDRSGSAAVRLLTGGFTAPLTVLVALFIMRRVPGNVIGPLLILWAANIAWTALRTDIDVPLLPVISDLSWYSLLIIALYFPTGRSHWKRYERWVDILCASVLLLLIVNWVGQESLMRGQMVENVLYVPIIARLQPLLTPFEVLIPFLIIGLALVSLFLRFRAAGTQERQQMKWLVWGFVMFLVTAIPFKIILWTTDSIDPTLNEIYSRFIYIFPALTIGMAILRHRLWDIDIIIRRTLIYSIFTAVLALLYFGGVVVAQGLLRAITGGDSDAANRDFDAGDRGAVHTIATARYRISLTVVSTAANMMPNGHWRLSMRRCATKWTWTNCKQRL